MRYPPNSVLRTQNRCLKLVAPRAAFSLPLGHASRAAERAVFVSVVCRQVAPGLGGSVGAEMEERLRHRWGRRLVIASVLSPHGPAGRSNYRGRRLRCHRGRSAAGAYAQGLNRRAAIRSAPRSVQGLGCGFFDTISIYFEGEGGEGLGQYGYSNDYRPDLR